MFQSQIKNLLYDNKFKFSLRSETYTAIKERSAIITLTYKSSKYATVSHLNRKRNIILATFFLQTNIREVNVDSALESSSFRN